MVIIIISVSLFLLSSNALSVSRTIFFAKKISKKMYLKKTNVAKISFFLLLQNVYLVPCCIVFWFIFGNVADGIFLIKKLIILAKNVVIIFCNYFNCVDIL